MTSETCTPEHYIKQLPAERHDAVKQLRKVIVDNLPQGFEEMSSLTGISYVVPHSLYPAGYHCTPANPLPFMSLVSQKNFIVLHHMGLYANKELLTWFEGEYPKYCKTKLNMGKGCVRFKKPEQTPFELIGELVGKMSCGDWISQYETALKR